MGDSLWAHTEGKVMQIGIHQTIKCLTIERHKFSFQSMIQGLMKTAMIIISLQWAVLRMPIASNRSTKFYALYPLRIVNIAKLVVDLCFWWERMGFIGRTKRTIWMGAPSLHPTYSNFFTCFNLRLSIICPCQVRHKRLISSCRVNMAELDRCLTYWC